MEKNIKKSSKIVIFFILLLYINTFYVSAEDKPYEKDGKLDFDNPDAIANALNNGKISVERLFKEKPSDAQIESVFEKVTNKAVQSQILSRFSNSNFAVNGQISSFKNGKLMTMKVNDFNVNDYKDFDGTININEDGSITILPNTKNAFKIDNTEVAAQNGNGVTITGNAGSRTITAINLQEGQSILLKNAQNEVKLLQGSVTTNGNFFTLQERSIAEFAGTKITTQNTKVDLGFNSGKNSYVLFDKLKKEAFLSGKDFSVEFFKNSVYDKIKVDGSNIKIINGQLSFIFDNKKIMLESGFGKGVKNMILTNLQTNQKVGITPDGGILGYTDPKFQRVGSFQRSIFLIHAYDAVLETDIDRVIKDYQILKGSLPANPNENKDFQYFVAENADTISLEIFSKRSTILSSQDIINGIQDDIVRSGIRTQTGPQGSLIISDKEIQSQRIVYENFLTNVNNQYGLAKVGSELISGIQNGKGFVAYYPDVNDLSNKLEKVFPNDQFVRNVYLRAWLTERTNVKAMPAELLKGFKK